MNQNNTGLQQINSFVTNNLKSANNAIKNTTNSIKNTAANIIAPLNQAVNASINETPASSIPFPIIVTLGILIILLIITVVFYKQIGAGMQKMWTKVQEFFGYSVPTSMPPPPSFAPPDAPPAIDSNIVSKMLPTRKEVFNVAKNAYTYADSEPLCKALGAELATYEQVKDAWKSGADWCNYGWVKGQAAIYPTQQDTYDKLQQGPEDQRMACGNPGVNGGYFDNPDMRFGVNCYGVKPSETDHDLKNIMASDDVPLTPGAMEYDRKVADYKAHQSEIAILPFKDGVWAN